MKTSINDPLRIAAVSPPGSAGVIGLTLCPGKKDHYRGWERDLDIDIAAIGLLNPLPREPLRLTYQIFGRDYIKRRAR